MRKKANMNSLITRIRIQGFRSYGPEPQEIDCDSPITVVYADNSQGKTSFAEGIEFLFSGRISRSSIFGGASYEYENMLSNIHMHSIDPDADIWVEAVIKNTDGNSKTVRRELVSDYDSMGNCKSNLIIDGIQIPENEEHNKLKALGILLNPQPIEAPVLLQHTLRYALSTEPKKRADYFSKMLLVDDIQIIIEGIKEAKKYLASLPDLQYKLKFDNLTNNKIFINSKNINDKYRKIKTKPDKKLVNDILIDISNLVLSEDVESLEGAIDIINRKIESASNDVFSVHDLRDFQASILNNNLSVSIQKLDLSNYINYIQDLQESQNSILPLLQEFTEFYKNSQSNTTDLCPVCNDGIITEERLNEIDMILKNSQHLNDLVDSIIDETDKSISNLRSIKNSLHNAIPKAVHENKIDIISQTLIEEPSADKDLRNFFSPENTYVRLVNESKNILYNINKKIDSYITFLSDLKNSVHQRKNIEINIPNLCEVEDEIILLNKNSNNINNSINTVSSSIKDLLYKVSLPPNARELFDLIKNKDDLHKDLCADNKRSDVLKRLNKVEKYIQAADKALLDQKFDDMSDEIITWWQTLRSPSEPVGFSGVTRKASGRRFVNLNSSLNNESKSLSAICSYSDSQLNALGLSTFLARQKKNGTPFIVLDDPLTGYDIEHRSSFSQDTINNLIKNNIQTIVLTHDKDLWNTIYNLHQEVNVKKYKIELTKTINRSDALFSRLFLSEEPFKSYISDAKKSLKTSTEDGRRHAANSLRNAAERLAKRIIATRDGSPYVTANNEVLGKLLKTMTENSYYIGNGEQGQWKHIKDKTNSGSHDNSTSIPSRQELEQIINMLNGLEKVHNKAGQLVS